MTTRSEDELEAKVAFRRISLGVLFALGLMLTVWFADKACRVADHTADNALSDYHEFEEIYATCQQLDSDLKNLHTLPETDRVFVQFSKSATILSKQQRLNRWVEDYNARSRMWDRAVWKSDHLPYRLSSKDFPNY